MTFIILVATSLLLFLAYKHLIYPAFLTPLSKIPPAHPTSPFSNLWIKWQWYRNKSNRSIHHAHLRHGPIIRLGQNEISVNDVDAIKTIYGGDWDKDDFYQDMENYEEVNMFSMTGKKEHSERKRMFGNVYSKSTLFCSEDFRSIVNTIGERLRVILDEATKEEEDVEVMGLMGAVSMDVISAYVFGLENIEDFVRDREVRKKWDVEVDELKNELRTLTTSGLDGVLRLLRLGSRNPKIAEAEKEENDICLCMLSKLLSSKESMEEHTPRTEPIIYNQLMQHLIPAKTMDESSNTTSKKINLTLASEIKDHLTAGTETTRWTLTYILYHLSLQPTLQSQLQEELCSLPPSLNQAYFRALDNLSLLHAIITETLRLNPAVPGSQPRITPPSSHVRICGYTITSSTRISAQAYTLHRNPVFESPEEWKPERWLEEKDREEMMRWFWGFGNGARGCIGREFAMLEVKILIAVIYGEFGTKVVSGRGGGEGMVQEDGYSTGPKSKELWLRFRRVG